MIARQCAPHRRLPLGRDEEQHESAAAGTQQFAAERTRCDPRLVKTVDGRGADRGVKLLLLHPRLVQQLAEVREAAVACQRVIGVVHQKQHPLQVVPNAFHVGELAGFHLVRSPSDTGEIQQQTVTKLPRSRLADWHALYDEVALPSEANDVETPE